MASDLVTVVESFTINSIIKDITFICFIGEVLYCRRDVCNRSSTATRSFCCAVCKWAMVVGHLSRKISAVCYVFLEKTGSMITGTVSYSIDAVLS